MSLENLAKKIQQGDNNAFEELYETLASKVFAFVYSFVRNKFDAEDLMQETFIKIKKNIDKYKPHTNFKAWIFEIAKNTTLNFLKKNERVSNLDQEVEVSDHNISLLIFDLKTFLSEKEYQILVLHAVVGLKHKEISKLLSISSGTVRWIYTNATKKTKEYLTNKEDKE